MYTDVGIVNVPTMENYTDVGIVNAPGGTGPRFSICSPAKSSQPQAGRSRVGAQGAHSYVNVTPSPSGSGVNVSSSQGARPSLTIQPTEGLYANAAALPLNVPFQWAHSQTKTDSVPDVADDEVEETGFGFDGGDADTAAAEQGPGFSIHSILRYGSMRQGATMPKSNTVTAPASAHRDADVEEGAPAYVNVSQRLDAIADETQDASGDEEGDGRASVPQDESNTQSPPGETQRYVNVPNHTAPASEPTSDAEGEVYENAVVIESFTRSTEKTKPDDVDPSSHGNSQQGMDAAGSLHGPSALGGRSTRVADTESLDRASNSETSSVVMAASDAQSSASSGQDPDFSLSSPPPPPPDDEDEADADGVGDAAPVESAEAPPAEPEPSKDTIRRTLLQRLHLRPAGPSVKTSKTKSNPVVPADVATPPSPPEGPTGPLQPPPPPPPLPPLLPATGAGVKAAPKTSAKPGTTGKTGDAGGGKSKAPVVDANAAFQSELAKRVQSKRAAAYVKVSHVAAQVAGTTAGPAATAAIDPEAWGAAPVPVSRSNSSASEDADADALVDDDAGVYETVPNVRRRDAAAKGQTPRDVASADHKSNPVSKAQAEPPKAVPSALLYQNLPSSKSDKGRADPVPVVMADMEPSDDIYEHIQGDLPMDSSPRTARKTTTAPASTGISNASRLGAQPVASSGQLGGKNDQASKLSRSAAIDDSETYDYLPPPVAAGSVSQTPANASSTLVPEDETYDVLPPPKDARGTLSLPADDDPDDEPPPAALPPKTRRATLPLPTEEDETYDALPPPKPARVDPSPSDDVYDSLPPARSARVVQPVVDEGEVYDVLPSAPAEAPLTVRVSMEPTYVSSAFMFPEAAALFESSKHQTASEVRPVFVSLNACLLSCTSAISSCIPPAHGERIEVFMLSVLGSETCVCHVVDVDDYDVDTEPVFVADSFG